MMVSFFFFFSIFANVLAAHLEEVLSRLICFDYAAFYQDIFPACHFQLEKNKLKKKKKVNQ